MGKKFTNMVCVYCATRSATTRDHVFARKFFPVARRGDLPQVPACQPCNKEKSDLEHYLTAVLLFGGRHADAAANLADEAPRRLAGNLALWRRLAAGMSRVWTREGGVYLRTSALPFEPEKLTKLFALIAKGLAWHHWRVVVASDTASWAGLLNSAREQLLTSWMAPAKMRVVASPGGGAFSYEGARASDNPNMTIWMFSVYGGLKLTGDSGAPHEETSKIGVLTGSQPFMDQFRKTIGEPKPPLTRTPAPMLKKVDAFSTTAEVEVRQDWRTFAAGLHAVVECSTKAPVLAL
jgi:hypothetical protein